MCFSLDFLEICGKANNMVSGGGIRSISLCVPIGLCVCLRVSLFAPEVGFLEHQQTVSLD